MSEPELPEELWGEKGSGRSLECSGSALVMGHTCEFEQEELVGVHPRHRQEAIDLKARLATAERERDAYLLASRKMLGLIESWPDGNMPPDAYALLLGSEHANESDVRRLAGLEPKGEQS